MSGSWRMCRWLLSTADVGQVCRRPGFVLTLAVALCVCMTRWRLCVQPLRFACYYSRVHRAVGRECRSHQGASGATPGAGDRTATSSTRKKNPVRSLERLLGSRWKREAVHVLTGGAKRCMMVHYRHVGEPLASLGSVCCRRMAAWQGSSCWSRVQRPDPTADDEKMLWRAGTAGRLGLPAAGADETNARRSHPPAGVPRRSVLWNGGG